MTLITLQQMQMCKGSLRLFCHVPHWHIFLSTTLGGQQGCPLSPNLFGLFIDELERVMLQRAEKADMPGLETGRLVPLLMFADDLLVLSTSATGLQNQLDALQDFCTQRNLTVNTAKTKIGIVVFEPAYTDTGDFTYTGRVCRFKSLGLSIDAHLGVASAPEERYQAANKALHALNSRCACMNIRDPFITCKLFDAIVAPVCRTNSQES